MAGRTDITEATRWAGRSMNRPFTILGLTSAGNVAYSTVAYSPSGR